MLDIPLPKPNDGEPQATFIARCMSNSQAKKDFPNNVKRTAVCFSQWRKTKGGEDMEIKRDEQGRIIVAENVKIIFNSAVDFNDDEVDDENED